MGVRSASRPRLSGTEPPRQADGKITWLDDPMTRRSFLGRAAALGISVSVAGTVLAACEQVTRPTSLPTGALPTGALPTGAASATPSPSPLITARPTFDATPPVVNPTPTAATYGPMLEATELVAVNMPSSSLSALLAEIAADGSIPFGTDAGGGRQARLSVIADDASFQTQAYRLEVASGGDGPTVTIRAGDEAGAYYGLVSLGQLLDTDGSTIRLRTATIEDDPGFARRGAILDPAPRTGVSTPASRTELLERVRLGVRHKLNFVDLPGRTPWPELVRYCDDHHVELMVGWGYRDALSRAPRQQLKDQLAAQLDAGARSISLNWDDIMTSNPEGLAAQHAEVFLDLYGFLRGRDPDVRVSAVLPPYGGVPGQNLVFSNPGEGERYLAAMKTALPDDVRVFWTGDGGIFSQTVTTAGAGAYRDAIGHELGLWDNDAIGFSRGRQACTGRAADLSSVVHSYMGNLAGEANWEGTNGQFALLTTLFYTWNPAAYDPATAAAAAEQILAG